MSKLTTGALIFALLLASGSGPVQRTVHQNEHLGIYRDIFLKEKPDDVEVVHSFLVSYTPRLEVVITADYEIELIAPADWIQEACKKLHLRKVLDTDSYIRKEERANDWYVPKDISSYDLYYLYLTSMPYIHMLVDTEPIQENRHRIFISKH